MATGFMARFFLSGNVTRRVNLSNNYTSAVYICYNTGIRNYIDFNVRLNPNVT